MTDAQTAAARRIAVQFDCENDYRLHERPFDRPEGSVLVTMGDCKGRRRSFCVSPSGEVTA